MSDVRHITLTSLPALTKFPSFLQVCELVRQGYSDAFLTAHFEVPGEMFTLAMQVWGCAGVRYNCGKSLRCASARQPPADPLPSNCVL